MLVAKNYRSLIRYLAKNPGSSILPTSLHDWYWMRHKTQAYGSISLFLPDGMPVVVVSRAKSNLSVHRVYGPTVLRRYLREHKAQKHVFLGSSETVELLKQKYPFAQSYPLAFAEDSEALVTKDLVQYLRSFRPDCIWIGVGSPKQVELCYVLRKHYAAANYFCVGAAFDFIVGKQKQAPQLFQNSGFEWLWRLATDPSRLVVRYLYRSPIGLLHLLRTQINVVE